MNALYLERRNFLLVSYTVSAPRKVATAKRAKGAYGHPRDSPRMSRNRGFRVCADGSCAAILRLRFARLKGGPSCNDGPTQSLGIGRPRNWRKPSRREIRLP